MALEGPKDQRTAPAQHELGVLVVLCSGTWLFFNSYGSINVTIPTIQNELGEGLPAIQWVATMGLVMSSSLALVLGRTGDLVGRGRLYKVGVTLYALGAALSAAAVSFPQLVGCRIVMTLGLAMAMPLASPILVSESSPARRGWMLGVLLSAGSVGRATGPAVGGLFLALSGWRAVFLANAAFGAIISLAVWLVLRRGARAQGGTFALGSAMGFILGYPSLLVALSIGASSRWASPMVPICLLAGASGVLGFVSSEISSTRPLIPPALLRNRRLVASFVALFLFSAAYFPILILSPLYLHNVLSISAFRLGLLLTTLPVIAALCSPVSGRLADRIEPWSVVIVGLALGVCGLLCYASLDAESDPWSVFLTLGLLGAGIGLVLPANQKSVFGATPREHYGASGGLLAVCGPGAGALGIGVAVALMEGIGGVAVESPAVFVAVQRSATLALLPLPVIALCAVYLTHRPWRRA